MKLFVLLLASVFGAFAQTPTLATTAISDMVYDAAGIPIRGDCTYKLTSGRATNVDGSTMTGELVTVRIVDGVFTANIVPTDTLTPRATSQCPTCGQSYTVTCEGTRLPKWSKSGTWIVPTTSTTLKLNDIWSATQPPTNTLLLPIQISAVGKPTGRYCLDVVNGAVVGLASCPSGSSSSPTRWSDMTSSWSSYTSAWSSYQ